MLRGSTFNEWLRYRFDRVMAGGRAPAVGLLVVVAAVFLLLMASLVVLPSVAPEGQDDLGMLLAGAALVATALPFRRALRVDPAIVLRAE